MGDAADSWRVALATYEELAADGDEAAVFLREVVRRLAGTPAGSGYVASAWDECLEVSAPGADAGRPWLAVVSDAVPNDWPRCEVEVRSIAGGAHAALERHPCVGPAAAAAAILRLLPRVVGDAG